jgi:hypothetical protein
MKSPKNQASLTSKSITKHIIPQKHEIEKNWSPSSSLRITIQIEKQKTNQIKEPIVKRNEILPADLGEINFLWIRVW